MTTLPKAELAATSLQEVLNRYYEANSQNARYRSEVATLRGKVCSLESLLEEKERRMILLTELLSHRDKQPTTRSPEQTLIEAGTTTT